jgi:hypothetical protein
VITAYKTAIVAMRKLPDTDPRSWIFQANMHGVSDSSYYAWNQCQHESFFFFSWHRMYLYFFERIVRSQSGYPQFALPYWNYYPSTQRSLPQPFRLPSDPSRNALYVQERDSAVNSGTKLPLSAVDHRAAFSLTNFTEPPYPSFGGPPVDQPTMHGPGNGSLENTPHNTVHTQVGGATGWMSSIELAARDPIFWLHHTNADRLWKRWLDLGDGRQNPVDNTVWLDQPFSFYDETGTEVQMTASQVLDTATQLGYVYDDDPAPASAQMTMAASSSTTPSSSSTASPPPKAAGAKAPASAPIQILAQIGQVDLVPTLKGASIQIGPVAPADHPILQFVDLAAVAPEVRGVYFEVYMNLPAQANPDPQSAHYVGNLTFFGLADMPGHAITQTFDITNQVRDQQARGLWKNGKIDLTFVPVGGKNLPALKALARIGGVKVGKNP